MSKLENMYSTYILSHFLFYLQHLIDSVFEACKHASMSKCAEM